MDIDDELDALLDLEEAHQEIEHLSQNDYPDELDVEEEKGVVGTPLMANGQQISSKEVDPELVEILNETIEINALEDEKENITVEEEEEKEQYIFSTPPEGSSSLCKLGDGSMVFLKRSSMWNKKYQTSEKVQLLSKPIEQLIDEVRENRVRKERIHKELEESSSLRSQQANWESSFQPRSFIHLISDEFCNRVFMKWLSQWKPMLFHTHENISTAEIDALPFFCPSCGKGGFHAKTCTKKQPLRPYYSPDLPSPLPTRPVNPLFILYGPTSCGKTTLVQVAAASHNLRLISFGGEMMGVSLEQTIQEIKNLFDNKGIAFGNNQPPLLFFDNFDTAFSLHERKAIVSFLLKKYKEIGSDSSKLFYPVVFCCNDIYASNVYELKSFYQQLKLPPIADSQQIQLLQRICVKQEIPHEVSALSALVAFSAGDVRFSLNSLHSLVLSDGKVTAQVVKNAMLSNKDMVQSIDDYYNLLFICSRVHGQRKSMISNVASIFKHYYDIHQDRIIDGVLEYLPTIPLPDPTLQRYSGALDTIIQYETISKHVKVTKNYSLQNVLPAYLCVIHSLYRREKPAKIKHVNAKAGYLAYQRIQQNRQMISPLKNSKALRMAEGCRGGNIVLDYLSPLMQVITPTIRPVDSLLLTSREKQELARITKTMIEYDLMYESSQNTGKLAIALKPDIEPIAVFPEIPIAFSKVVNTVKFKIQAEIQRMMIGGDKHEEKSKTSEVKPVESSKSQTTPKKRAASSFFESPKKKLQMDVTVDESRLEKEMTPIKKTSFFNTQQISRNRKLVKGVVFRYQQGFTCAVRQPATIHDFL